MRVFIPWNEFLPDLGQIRNEGICIGSEGFLDIHGHYTPAPAIAKLPSGSISGAPQVSGVYGWCFGPTDYRIYTGNTTKLWEYDALTPAVDEVSRTVGGAYASDEWFFTGFGGHVIAVNGADADQILLSTATDFQDCYTSTDKPVGKYVSTLKSHLVIGNYTLGGTAVPHGVWISATDDARQMLTGGTDNSDNQPLNDDLGHVMGLSRGREYLLIARERGWTRLDGPPYEFANIDTSDGLYYSRSIADLGQDTYYLSRGGPRVVREGAQVIDIGKSKVSRLMTDLNFFHSPLSTSGGRLNVSGVADPASDLILWSWDSANGDVLPGLVQHFVAYNPKVDRFSYFRANLAFASEPTNIRFGSMTQRPLVGVIEHWGALRQVVSALFSGSVSGDDTSFVEFSDTSGVICAFQTGLQSHEQEAKQRYTRVRPVFRMKDGVAVPEITVTLETTDYASGPITSTDTLTVADQNGWYYPSSAHEAGNFLAVKFRFGDYALNEGTPLGVAEFEGFEADYETVGEN